MIDPAPRANRAKLLRAAGTVGALTAVSRVLGFARDLLMAAALGAGPVADAFLVAFRLPDLFRRLFAEGAFASAFVPLAGRVEAEQGAEALRRYTGKALSTALVLLAGTVVAGELAMPWILALLAPGFEQGAADALFYARLLLPYLVLMGAAAVLGARLNLAGRFAAPAATPILLNLCLLAAAGAALAAASPAAPILALATLGGGIVQVGFLVMAAHRAGVLPRLEAPGWRPEPRRLFGRALPGIGSAGLGQLAAMGALAAASLLPAGAVTHVHFADRIAQLPLGLIGTALGSTLLPALVEALRSDARDEVDRLTGDALLSAWALTVPAALGLYELAGPIARILYVRGAFTPADGAATGAFLAWLAWTLPLAALARLLAVFCYARDDTRGPFLAGLLALVAQVAASFALAPGFGLAGIGAAAILGATLQMMLLLGLAIRRGILPPQPSRSLPLGRMARILLAGILMAAALELAPVTGPFTLAVAILGGAAVYFLAAFLLGGLDRAILKRR